MPMAKHSFVYTLSQVREIEACAKEKFKFPEQTMMLNAATAALHVLSAEFNAKQVSILCGAGNNAGDGYVLARLLQANGFSVEVNYLKNPEALSGVAYQAAEEARNADVTMSAFDGSLNGDVIVDALLGIGINGLVKQEWQAVIESVNAMNIPVLSLDLPSGIQADTGEVLGAAIEANVTVSFIGAKIAHCLDHSRRYCGKVFVDDIGLPQEVFDTIAKPVARVMDLTGFYRPRNFNANKGDFGHVLVVGGDHGMPGAVRMASEAALRVGAGVVSIATREEHIAAVIQQRPEVMVHGVEDNISPLLAKADVCIVGPGLGRSDWSRTLLQQALNSNLPLLVDADALYGLAQTPQQRDNWVLTPHPGEAGQLLGLSAKQVQADRWQALHTVCDQYHGVCVLKGAGTLVGSAGALDSICFSGNPGMAVAGMGDVLSGVIGGLLAQGYSLRQAAEYGVCLHAMAGDEAAKQGMQGLIASDLMPELRRLVDGPLCL